MRLAVAVTLALTGLSACVPPPAPAPGIDPTGQKLADAALRAATALESLSLVEQARTPTADLAPPPDVPEPLGQIVTVSWIGPVEPIARRLAERAGYVFRTMGDEPSTPIIVALDMRDQRLFDILRDIGLQLDGRADLVLDANQGLVEVRYAPIDRP